MIDVEAARAQIPVCQHAIYMNTGWSGPSPRPVLDAIVRQLERESAEGPASPRLVAAAHEIDADVRAEVAALVGATAEEIGLLQSTTEGLHVVLNALNWKPGDEAITFGLEHSSPLTSTLLLRRRGITVRVLDLGPTDGPEVVLAGIRATLTPNTRLVCLSHVQYATGFRMPVAEICALVQPLGVQVIVDGAQAVGQIALDLTELGVDYYAMPGQKWLLGPEGVGALYVRSNHVSVLEPRNPYLTGRGAGAEERILEEQISIRKLELSTTSVALRAGLGEAIRFIRAQGLEGIEWRNGMLASRLKRELASIEGVTVLSPLDPAEGTGLVAARLAGLVPRDVVGALWNRWKIAARSIDELDAVRFSLHFFNTEDEVLQVVSAITELLAEAGRSVG